MKTVIILRGLPGSGKTAFSKLLPDHAYVSMDLYWTRNGQPYQFDYGQLNFAIGWTQQQFDAALQSEKELVVVDNVNYDPFHFRYFLDKAEKEGARIHIIHVERPWEELNSEHSLPPGKVEDMAKKWVPV